ncbi:IclR family transcriptional regulator domain-containing protein [Sphingomonas echinoides]|uniref:IclR family transcriptional regulator domain-containing protein n=1 Tax=Sphingomonas echinoides TaxID=59803 RepID=UPI0024138BE4|nr:IclR family transcriptional regulator C-terminal domain-containing protein [Sphingomonas echinoides]
MTPPPADPRHMLSLARGLAVFEALAELGPGQSVARIAEATGLARAVCGRCLFTLEAAGYVECQDRRYALRPSVLRLAAGYMGERSLPALAQPLLDRLRDAVGESASLGVLDRSEVLYLARASRDRIMAVGLHVGSRLPLATSSMGRVLLAQLPDDARDATLADHPPVAHTPRTLTDPDAVREELRRVAARGYALVDQELDLGLRSIAVPVRARDGRVIAAMNVGAHALRVSVNEMTETILPQLIATAGELGGQLG